ncbi:hypothetical protein ACZ90_67175 [Streptomyces albus subsp. albus]|nr:hypothetical protein ACZ90_67175 [Streptomyces albus subsp. albus]
MTWEKHASAWPDTPDSTRTLATMRAVRKAYGATVALDGIDLAVHDREVLGVLGPNGAGKTTLLESLVGLRRHDAGTITVLGHDPRTERTELLRQVSVQPQTGALMESLTVAETVRLFAALRADGFPVADVLDMVGLTDRADTRVKVLSTGQQQRVRLAIAMVGKSRLTILDEPTGSLDPQAKELAWDAVRTLALDGGVVVSTHSMEEAEAVCDRLLVMDGGRVVAQGPPQELVREHAADGSVILRTRGSLDEKILSALPAVRMVSLSRRGAVTTAHLVSDASERTLSAARSRIQDLDHAESRRPSLRDAFVALTGRDIREGGDV